MDISLFFGKKKQLPISIKNEDKVISNKQLLFKQYLNILNKLLSQNLLDILDYTFLINFAKTKGTLINTFKFHVIFNQIIKNDLINENDKIKFKESCNILFKHI